jgi:hypothetical protein
MNAFNLLEKKKWTSINVVVNLRRGVTKKNGRGKKVENEGMKLWREINKKREEEK